MKISDLLGNSQCRLHKLDVSECSIGEEGYKCLYSAVRSNPESHLIELDLRGNDPGETGVKLIYQLIQDHKCKLNTVRLLSSSSAVKAFEYLTETLGINPLLQREVNLSDHKLDESRVNQICDLLKDKHCHINTLILRDCGLTEESCSALASVLSSNISVKELDMSNNHLQDSGVKKLQTGLENIHCQLQKLSVSECSIGEEGYKCLYSAVRSNPESHLIELDLRGNDPGETGVKLIYQLIQDHKCKLNTVRFLKTRAAEEACDHLCKALDVNPLLLKELNLSHNKLGDLDGEKLSALLMDSHSKVTKIIVSECSIGEEGYKCLYSAVRSNPESHLIELDLRGNDPGETGVKLIYQLIQDHKCKLNTVRLRDCGLTEESCSALASVLSSNISVKELDMSNNHLQDSGVKKLQTGLENIHCQLQKLRFLKSCAAEEACDHLCKALDVNPLLLKELNLSHNKLGDLDGEKLSALLMDSHSKVTKIILNDCELTENQCSALAAVLSCKTLVKEMNLSNSPLMDSGLKHICDQLEKPQCQLQILNFNQYGQSYEALDSCSRFMNSSITQG
ncbi:ribonuclease inhibitor-like [Triplophysa dalaica]|uniref:ribonuclease inhibitor-like n=1 Tax=Triplophysa dalaica TaxID=1582913 RepID=UPI0024DFA9C9|nr:ribonuclease inhibitor-like [Triplophysa dalaica]